MNEPYITHIGTEVDRTPITEFLTHVHGLARDQAPDVPLSIGEATVAWVAEHEANIGEQLDVVSFHSLGDAVQMRADIEAAKDLAGSRPVYLSEWGYFPGGDDAEQLAAYETLLPTVVESGIGWAASHLIAGYGPFANTALLYPSGVMRPAALYVRRLLASKR